MNVTFCPNCGSKHPYTYAKPKFCSSCGFNLGPELKSSKAPVAAAARDSFEDDDDVDFSDADYVPQIRKIDVDVEEYAECPSFTLGSLFGDNSRVAKARRRQSTSISDFVNQKSNRGE
jgi:hypothetical protein